MTCLTGDTALPRAQAPASQAYACEQSQTELSAARLRTGKQGEKIGQNPQPPRTPERATERSYPSSGRASEPLPGGQNHRINPRPATAQPIPEPKLTRTSG